MVPLTSVYRKCLHLVSLDAEVYIFPLLYFEICKYFVLIYVKIKKNNIHLQEDLKQIRMHIDSDYTKWCLQLLKEYRCLPASSEMTWTKGTFLCDTNWYS